MSCSAAAICACIFARACKRRSGVAGGCTLQSVEHIHGLLQSKLNRLHMRVHFDIGFTACTAGTNSAGWLASMPWSMNGFSGSWSIMSFKLPFAPSSLIVAVCAKGGRRDWLPTDCACCTRYFAKVQPIRTIPEATRRLLRADRGWRRRALRRHLIEVASAASSTGAKPPANPLKPAIFWRVGMTLVARKSLACRSAALADGATVMAWLAFPYCGSQTTSPGVGRGAETAPHAPHCILATHTTHACEGRCHTFPFSTLLSRTHRNTRSQKKSTDMRAHSSDLDCQGKRFIAQ